MSTICNIARNNYSVSPLSTTSTTLRVTILGCPLTATLRMRATIYNIACDFPYLKYYAQKKLCLFLLEEKENVMDEMFSEIDVT